MNQESPFAVLGVSRELMSRLSPEVAFHRVRAIYHAVMLEAGAHPDKGGDQREAARLNDAWRELSASPATFDRIRQEYVRLRPIEDELTSLRRTLQTTTDRIARIFEAFGVYVQLAAERLDTKQLTAFSARGVVLTLHDEIRSGTWDPASPAEDLQSYLDEEPSEAQLRRVDKNLTRSITIDLDGAMTIAQGGAKKCFGGSRRLVGTLANLATSDLMKTVVGDRPQRPVGLLTGSDTGHPNLIESPLILGPNRFSRRLLPYLRADLAIDRLLVSLTRDKNGSHQFNIEGTLESVETIEKGPMGKTRGRTK